MKKIILSSCFLIILFTLSCKKEKDAPSSENNLITFSIFGQVSAPEIDNVGHKISVKVPETANKSSLSCSFTVSKDALVTLNNIPQTSGNAIIDGSKPISMGIMAANGNVSNWTITIISTLEEFGFTSAITASKSINQSFNWYYDQSLSGQFASINCGPAVATMAIKWSDPSFSKTPEDARNTYRTTGGWWFTNDIVSYFEKYGINSMYTTLPDKYQTIKNYLDKGYIVVLCLDNFYIRYNSNNKQHIDKYYRVNAAGSGHFIIVKGYKQTSSNFYFEVYDPWSYGMTYDNGQLKGVDRYYNSDDLENATNVWWDYAIIVAPKGKTVTKSAVLNPNARLLSVVPAQKGG